MAMKVATKTAAKAKPNDDALADDILFGAAQIATFVFGDPQSRKRVYYYASPTNPNERLPVFRLGATLCARRSTLREWITKMEGRST